MASIPFTTTPQGNPGAGTPSVSANGAGGIASILQGSAEQTGTGTSFMQLFAGMTSGNASQALPADLAALAGLTGETGSAEDETETTDADEGALALAALIPGMLPLPAPDGELAGGSGTSSDEIAGALMASRTLLETSQAAAEAALDTLAEPTTDTDPSSAPADSQPAFQTLMGAHRASEATQPAPALQNPVSSAAWRDELGTQLTLMAANGRESASLRLSPEHLGPLEIRISMQDGQATVQFGAASAETRSALEQSLPRLRELFASQGLVLADAGVSRDAPRQTFKPGTSHADTRGSSDAGPESTVSSVTVVRAGLIDTYA